MVFRSKEDALQFLALNQPLPPTLEMSEDIAEKYDCARKFFLENPDSRCVEYFLNSFGEGDGHGIYQLVGDVLTKYDKSFVLPLLERALSGGVSSVKYWCAQIAEQYPCPQIAPALISLLSNSDSDIRTASVISLSDIEGEFVTEALNDALSRERDSDLIEILRDVLEERLSGGRK